MLTAQRLYGTFRDRRICTICILEEAAPPRIAGPRLLRRLARRPRSRIVPYVCREFLLSSPLHHFCRLAQPSKRTVPVIWALRVSVGELSIQHEDAKGTKRWRLALSTGHSPSIHAPRSWHHLSQTVGRISWRRCSTASRSSLNCRRSKSASSARVRSGLK
jgi:hypothetical protein